MKHSMFYVSMSLISDVRGVRTGWNVKDNVLLKSNYTGQEMTVQEKDARLYELDINEGDKVFLIEGEMRKLR